ncbi:MAG: cellulose biosynthesis protein BcsG [Burkholderiales bacterium]
MEKPSGTSADAGGDAPGRAAAPPWLGLGRASDRLGPWSLYFIAKLVLAWLGLVGLHALGNLVLLATLAGPLADPRWRRLRPWLGVPAAAALLYGESWLPGFSRVLSQAGLLSSFSADYLAELAGRFVSVPVVAALAVAAAAWFVAARFVRVDAWVALALVATAFVGPRAAPGTPAPAAAAASPVQAADPEARLRDFLEAESKRTVAFPRPPEGSAPFDLLFVHVCSLSWDDLRATGQAEHPFLKGLDIVLTRFNAVSTYSGPSAIRFLRAGCGQQAHRALYEPAPQACYLMPALEGAGFETRLVLGHDGHFDDFLAFVRAQGVTAAPMPLDGIAAPQRSFDGSRIRDDLAVLSRWLALRAKSPAPRTATYFNSTSLHDGNRLADDPGKASRDTYPKRLATLLDGLGEFSARLAKSGRRVVLVLVPEHGAALRGDAMQIPGLREIPSPAITLVPVGLKVIGPGARREGEALRVDGPTSYLALSRIVARMLEKPPFGDAGFRPADYAADLPATDFVSEGETAALVEAGGRRYLRLEREPWREYRESAGP